jgi:hypothetical protein
VEVGDIITYSSAGRVWEATSWYERLKGTVVVTTSIYSYISISGQRQAIHYRKDISQVPPYIWNTNLSSDRELTTLDRVLVIIRTHVHTELDAFSQHWWQPG